MGVYYKGINHSTNTQKKRNELKRRMDKFTSFSWRGYDAFDNFGAFIINEKKGSLQFYNGPGFSNEYSKPQFDTNGGDLIGVTVNRQQIKFTIGVYWICIEDYRKFLDWLDYKTVSFLTFGYEPRYRYNVKLASLGDSTKHIIGREENKDFYYTELKLVFDVQGKPCAIGTKPYEFDFNTNEKSLWIKKYTPDSTHQNYKELTDYTKSDLDFPIKISTSFSFKTKDEDNHLIPIPEKYKILLKAGRIEDTNIRITNDDWTASGIQINDEITLYEVHLKNLTIGDSESYPLNLTYQSDSGLLFLSYGNSNGKLLNLLNLEDTGKKIVDFFFCNKFLIPGSFSWGEDFTQQLKIYFELQEFDGKEWSNAKVIYIEKQQPNEILANPLCEAYARTNIA